MAAVALSAGAVVGCSSESSSPAPGTDRTPATPDGNVVTAADTAARPSDGFGDAATSSEAGQARDGGAVVAPSLSPSLDPNLSPEERWPLHGVALFHQVNIYSGPNSRSIRLGVLRRGARVRIGPPHEGRGCRGGRWHPVRPAGYVCSGRTMRIGEEPPHLAFTPTPPRVDRASPYEHGRNRRAGAPLYRRIPRASEIAAEREYQVWLAAQRAAPAPGPADGGPPETAEEREEREEREEEEREERSRTGPIVTRLERGFYVTIERTIIEDGRRWIRTSELNYVDANAIFKRRVPEIEGTELGRELSLPILMNPRSSKSRRLDERGRPKLARVLEEFTTVPLLGETKLSGELYYTIGDNEVVAAKRFVRIDAIDLPPGVGVDERWIDVNLRRQFLVAYEGSRPVYATLVSSGERGHETPTGEFRITNKHISTDMSDAPDGGEPYLIQDVPWTMYFNLAIALHGAFWHSRFGRERSHGCINLAPADARWLFNWVGPELPERWHGVTATEDNPGTRVFVHR